MRAIALSLILILAACTSVTGDTPADAPTDADQCSRPVGTSVPDGCVPGGLAVDLNGVWTFTGTEMSDPYGLGMWTTSQSTRSVAIVRLGSGWCVFGLAFDGNTATVDNQWYVTDNFAQFDQAALGARVPEVHEFLCRRGTDQALHYTSSQTGFQMQHQASYKLDGVLSR